MIKLYYTRQSQTTKILCPFHLSSQSRHIPLTRAAVSDCRKLKSSITTSGRSTIQRLRYTKEKRYSKSNAIPQIPTHKNIPMKPLHYAAFRRLNRYVSVSAFQPHRQVFTRLEKVPLDKNPKGAFWHFQRNAVQYILHQG